MPSLGHTVAALAKRRSAVGGDQSASSRLKKIAAFGLNRGGLMMLTHVPQHLEPGAALVVVLRGCTQTAEVYAAGAGWLELADRYGFVVLCPEQ